MVQTVGRAQVSHGESGVETVSIAEELVSEIDKRLLYITSVELLARDALVGKETDLLTETAAGLEDSGGWIVAETGQYALVDWMVG